MHTLSIKPPVPITWHFMNKNKLRFLWLMMNKMNMKFHKICAIVKEISVHNGNVHVHQAPFSDGTASNKKKKKEKKS